MTALRDEAIPHVRPLAAGRPGVADPRQVVPRERSVYTDAEEFLRAFHRARPKAGQVEARLAKVRAEIAATGT